MKLKEALNGIQYEVLDNKEIENVDVTNINNDSRAITLGGLFICIDGFKMDGHDYIQNAIENGAKVIIISKDIEVLHKDIIYIKIDSIRENLAVIASNFYNNPCKKLKFIGVTGTKGKTTTTFMLKTIFENAGYKVGLIGTIANYVGNKVFDTANTTPDALELQKLFSEMVKEKVDVVVMEVSSHALDLKRVDGIRFNVGVFTNLTQDHLDYHINFENYFNAKRELFKMCDVAIINIDDEYGKRLYNDNDLICKKVAISTSGNAEFIAYDININSKDIIYKLKNNDVTKDIDVPIPGLFSVYNSLYAIATAVQFNIDYKYIIKGLSEIKVTGRAEIVKSDKDFAVMIDYAHSPGSLESILNSVKLYCKGEIICVFGCGGDRDNTKRPIMGKISGELADFSIITSDNPRTENPIQILNQIEDGIKEISDKYIVIEDRYKAIEYGIKKAKANDIVLIAGKGHETYQIFKDKTIHFDDAEVAKEVLDSL